MEKVLFKADFFFCMTEMQRQTTLAHNLNIPPPPPRAKAFLLVTDNRRSQLDSPFWQSHSTGKLNLVITDKVRRYAVQELTMQLSQTLSSSIAQINVSNSYSTNQCFKQPNYKSHRKAQKRSCSVPTPSFNFCIT